MTKIPYLSVEKRAQYLLDKGYTQEPQVSDLVREHLKSNNFHHFLGYARNYGSLIAKGRIAGEISLDKLVHIINADKAISVILFEAFQTLEHQLRAQLVEAHCTLYSPTGCFLQSSHFIQTSIDRDTAEVSLINQILRMKEPYVVDRLERYMKDNHLHGSPEKLVNPHRVDSISGLPIWSFVDGLSLGLLTEIILNTQPKASGTDQESIRDLVASMCSVPRNHIETQLKSLIVLRNQVAHHSRLWMRPSTNSPKVPNSFKKIARGVDAKGMYVVWLTLASFFSDKLTATNFLARINEILEANPDYTIGVKNPIR